MANEILHPVITPEQPALPSGLIFPGETPAWNATPFALTTDPDLNSITRNLPGKIAERTHEYVDENTPEPVHDLLQFALQVADTRRGIKNHDSYHTRLKQLNPNFHEYAAYDAATNTHRQIADAYSTEHMPLSSYVRPGLMPLEEAARTGRITPKGALFLQRELDLTSIELAKTTLAGHEWETARMATRIGMVALGGRDTWVEDIIDNGPTIGIAATTGGVSEAGELLALTVRARKFRGEIDEQTRVREVFSLIVRVDEESGFDQNLAKELHRSHDAGTAPRYTIGKNETFAALMREVILDDTTEMPSWVIPVTSTIYAYDGRTAR